MPKIQPAIQTITYSLVNGENYIDLSQSASIVNRRFYRQGLNWAVAGFTFVNPVGSIGSFVIRKIPNSWVASNSWHKIYAAWKKQQDDAMDDAGGESAIAKFRDFKIFMDAAHTAAPANLLPLDAAGGAFDQGEWEYSKVVTPNTAGVVGDTDEFTVHMVGPDTATGFGMIHNYALSRALPHSPSPSHLAVQDNMLSEMFNVGMDDSEIVDNATNTNDNLPYDQDEYPGGATNAPTLEVVNHVGVSATTIANTTRISGTNFPCGLINVDVNGAPLTGTALLVHLVPGPHRGYLAEPMQDM